MNDIDRLLRTTAIRLFLIDFLRTLTILLTAGLGVMLAVVAAHKLTAWDPAFGPVAAGVFAAAVVGAACWSLARRPRGLALADEVDRRAGLRETLSTAIVVSRAEDGWSRSIVETASERARGVRASQAAPIEAPRLWWLPSVLLLLIGTAALLPRHDITGLLAKKEAEAEQQRELALVKSEIQSEQKELDEMLKRAGVQPELGEQESQLPEAAQREPLTPEEARRQAVRRLTSLRDQLAEKRSGEKGKTLDALKDELSKLTKPGPGPMSEFGRKLARGEFSGAKSALDEAMKSLESGSLSEAQKQQMQEQLARLAEQLEQMSETNEQIKQALTGAGIDPSKIEGLMTDPEALEQAIEQAQNLTEAQKQALKDAAKAQENASNACQGMASALGQMAAGMSGQQGSQSGQQSSQGSQAAQQLAEQLSQMEMLAQEMAAAEMAMAECQGQMAALGQSMCEGGACMGGGSQPGMAGKGSGQGAWQPGQSTPFGSGSGGAGKGNGAPGPDAQATDYNLTAQKASVQDQGGPIIGETTIFGKQLIGESRREHGEAVAQAAARAEDAVETMRVPRELRESVRQYFGSVQEVTAEGDEPAE